MPGDDSRPSCMAEPGWLSTRVGTVPRSLMMPCREQGQVLPGALPPSRPARERVLLPLGYGVATRGSCGPVVHGNTGLGQGAAAESGPGREERILAALAAVASPAFSRRKRRHRTTCLLHSFLFFVFLPKRRRKLLWGPTFPRPILPSHQLQDRLSSSLPACL